MKPVRLGESEQSVHAVLGRDRRGCRGDPAHLRTTRARASGARDRVRRVRGRAGGALVAGTLVNSGGSVPVGVVVLATMVDNGSLEVGNSGWYCLTELGNV